MTTVRNSSPPPPTSTVNLIAAFATLGMSAVLGLYWLDRHTYRQGETAYQEGNCEAAMPRFQRLAQARRFYDFNDYQARAKTRISECEVFLATVATSSGPADQLLAYEAFANRYKQGPLVEAIQTQANRLVSETDLVTLAVRPLCDRREALMAHRLVPMESEPKLAVACGHTYEAEADHEAAIAAYTQVLQGGAPETLVTQAETALARVLVAQANAEGASTISQPGWSGYTREGNTKLVVRNDSPERMRIVFSGPEPYFEEIAPCEDCKVYGMQGPETCPNKGPLATFELKPGDYEVMVRSVSDPTVNPFTGEWSLTTGQAYNSCFYLARPLPSQQ